MARTARPGIEAIEVSFVNAATGLERDPPTASERQRLARQIIALVARAVIRNPDVVVVSKAVGAPAAAGDQPRQAENRKA